MLEDLVRACKPRRMTVEVACNPRGGMGSTVTASYDRDAMGPPERLGKKKVRGGKR